MAVPHNEKDQDQRQYDFRDTDNGSAQDRRFHFFRLAGATSSASHLWGRHVRVFDDACSCRLGPPARILYYSGQPPPRHFWRTSGRERVVPIDSTGALDGRSQPTVFEHQSFSTFTCETSDPEISWCDLLSSDSVRFAPFRARAVCLGDMAQVGPLHEPPRLNAGLNRTKSPPLPLHFVSSCARRFKSCHWRLRTLAVGRVVLQDMNSRTRDNLPRPLALGKVRPMNDI